jgi:hypothetical protein
MGDNGGGVESLGSASLRPHYKDPASGIELRMPEAGSAYLLVTNNSMRHIRLFQECDLFLG